MNSDIKTDPSVERLVAQKQQYGGYVKNLSLSDRLRRLERLQEQTYEILSIREKNGGKPIPQAWQKWAKARGSVKK